MRVIRDGLYLCSDCTQVAVVAEDGQMLGAVAIDNYTPNCFVQLEDLEARWDETLACINTDALAEIILKHWYGQAQV